ncbi:hypothetical protein [Methanobrevibacter filiformis]|uniref:Uncharacterized protein n=1 Tax=Methanobrevibacter filiformis TaxID=55758 RepID=A0A166F4T1_9EURY|nr:hypothetical protein [Methanobrevibacter filiformis]KZX17313.1 hypothetical protein MBFIL_02410 [Methanobrevibacter filiformis]
MSPIKKANFIVIIIIAIIALGASTAVASYTENQVKEYLQKDILASTDESNNKLTIVSDEDFKPLEGKEIPIIIKNNTTNNTNNTNYTYNKTKNQSYYNNQENNYYQDNGYGYNYTKKSNYQYSNNQYY